MKTLLVCLLFINFSIVYSGTCELRVRARGKETLAKLVNRYKTEWKRYKKGDASLKKCITLAKEQLGKVEKKPTKKGGLFSKFKVYKAYFRYEDETQFTFSGKIALKRR